MTSKLPFGLKTKPTRRYVAGHSIAYIQREGKLFGIITKTTRTTKTPLFEFEITSREQVEKLKKVESIDELRKLTTEIHI